MKKPKMFGGRTFTQDYLQAFVSAIQAGHPVTFVEDANFLAVNHPSEGYLVLQIKDKLIDNSNPEGITNGSL